MTAANRPLMPWAVAMVNVALLCMMSVADVSAAPTLQRSAAALDDLVQWHNRTRALLQPCLARFADIGHPPTSAAATFRNALRNPGPQSIAESRWVAQRRNVSSPRSGAAWRRGDPDFAGIRDVPFWRYPDGVPANDTELRRCRALLKGFGDREQVLRDVFGVTPGMVRLGDGGTDGNFDKGTDEVHEPPVHEDSTHVTEAIGSYLGASLSRDALVLSSNLLLGPFTRSNFDRFIPPPLYKWKAVFQRSASYYDAATKRTHIVRLVWATAAYVTTIPTVVRSKLLPVFNLTNRTYVTAPVVRAPAVKGFGKAKRFPLKAVHMAYLLCTGGEWEMEFMDNKRVPHMIVDPTNRRNWTAGIAYFRNYTPSAAAALGELVSQFLPFGAAPTFWREQPLPGCNTWRFNKGKKKLMQCSTVLRPVLVPAFREAIKEHLGNTFLAVLPIDFLVEPHHPPHPSSAGVAPTLRPPKWSKPSAKSPLCLLDNHDGMHLPSDCLWLELQSVWASSVAWHGLWRDVVPGAAHGPQANAATDAVAPLTVEVAELVEPTQEVATALASDASTTTVAPDKATDQLWSRGRAATTLPQHSTFDGYSRDSSVSLLLVIVVASLTVVRLWKMCRSAAS